jgi:serine-type D-Ala-D-Ala carboxypeptidase/endopeptidase (penicillin-binding protein 4)
MRLDSTPVRSLARALAHPCVLAIASITLLAPAALADALDGLIREAAAKNKLDKTKLGIAIYDTDSKESLGSIESRQMFIPASNLKLITSGVALAILGPKFEFQTSFYMDGTRLIIQGGGDPALGDPKLLDEMGWTVQRFIDRLVDSAVAAKIPQVTEIVIDDRVFEQSSAVHPSWPANQLNRWYCAPVSGLNFHTNVVEIYARRGERVGLRPELTIQPSAPWIEPINTARTVADGSTSIWAEQVKSQTSFQFEVKGDVRETLKDPIEVTVSQPGLMLARLLADGLGGKGLLAAATAGNQGTIIRFAGSDEDFAGGSSPFAVVTTPISRVLARCNQDSQNLYAEALLKRACNMVTKKPGSWTDGATVVTMTLTEKLGQTAREIRMADGSGLSADNAVSPELMVRWLGYLREQPSMFPMFLESMARADETARLERRFRDRRLTNTVYAKTGFIRKVRGLSGYVVSKDGSRVIAYSILANEIDPTPHQRVMDFQEDVVQIVDRWLTRQLPAGGRAEIPE